ncbi:hypothetical protein GCM10025876_38680 [Demequina litorisediminis]|uniref:Uncharacterized protein n=1 Tax=Demequina litorisediminis TaxID=1849022 RepID=A0ABQ6ILV7_9MICO|nr:hypothetical protein GCM10025876_38680 [Demequina litorisediminis]
MYSPLGVTLPGGAPGEIASVADGTAAVQDEGSQLAALALVHADAALTARARPADAVTGSVIDPGERWLDMCAGPGGKAALLAAAAAEGMATLDALELHDHRADLVRRSLKAIPDAVATVHRADARTWSPAEPYDRILLDAPCTGLGALRRRPEARWRRSIDDLDDLVDLQHALISHAGSLLAPGGVLAYVTCSPVLAETLDVVEGSGLVTLDTRVAVASATGTEPADWGRGPHVQLWPHVHGTDAMFIQALDAGTSMTPKATLTPDRVVEAYDGAEPLRTLTRLLGHQRGRVAAATAAFVVKHSPVWVMPLVTAMIIDAVVEHAPLRELVIAGAVMVLVVAQNYPTSLIYIRQLSIVLRTLEASLRLALTRRLQELSIGYHRRTSAGTLQAKVIRDVEQVVEATRQTFDTGLAAATTVVGALVLTAFRVPEFLLVYLLVVPLAATLVLVTRRAMRSRNAQFRSRMEEMSVRVAEMTHLIPVTRAHASEDQENARVDEAVSRVRVAGMELDIVNGRFGALSWIGFQVMSVLCLVGAGVLAWYGIWGITAGDVVLLSSYFAQAHRVGDGARVGRPRHRQRPRVGAVHRRGVGRGRGRAQRWQAHDGAPARTHHARQPHRPVRRRGRGP